MTARSTTVRGLVAGAAASAFAVAAMAAPAQAATTVFTDARDDVAHGADIHRVKVVNEDRIRVRVVHDDLVRSYRSDTSIAVFFDTDRMRTGPEFVLVGGTFEGADYALLPADGWKRDGRRQVPLNGGSYDMELDYAKDAALIRIDREVLGNPGAVRVEVRTGGANVSTGEGAEKPAKDWLGKPRTFTSWVKRG